MKNNQEFEDKYAEYAKTVERTTGGLVETNKADFVKISAYFETVIIPQLKDFEDKQRDTIFNYFKHK